MGRPIFTGGVLSSSIIASPREEPVMTVRSGQVIVVEVTTRVFATGVGTDADSLPAGTLVLNGVDNAAVVTVTKISTGRYKASVTLPTLAIGDIVELVIAATVSAVVDSAVVWRGSKDVLLDASGNVTFNNTTITNATNVTNPVNLGVYGPTTSSVGG